MDDLQGMIRHENRLLVLIFNHEIDDVVPRVFTVNCADCQEALVHEVRVSDTDIRYLLSPDDVVHVQGKKADKRKIQLFSSETCRRCNRIEGRTSPRGMCRRTTIAAAR